MAIVSLVRGIGRTPGVPVLIAGLFLVGACAQPTLVPASESLPVEVDPASPTADLVSIPTSGPTLVPTALVPSAAPVPSGEPTLAPTAPPTPQPVPGPVRLEIADGSEARYLVKEQFARRNVPNDAVGKTRNVSGAIVFDGSGSVVRAESVLQVDLSALRSDEDDRDDYLRGESLESDEFPLAEFGVTGTPGLPWPLATEGEVSFQLLGDMTIHGTTSPLVWEVTVQLAPDRIGGTARTNFKFARFHLVRPTRLFLLSVEDNIRLELDFVVSVAGQGGSGRINQ